MIIIEIIIITLFLVWGIATIFYQFKLTETFISRFNYFSMVPKWTFFAPIPKTSDFVLYYQDCDIDSNEVFDPVEVPLHGKEDWKHFIKTIWNPKKRPLKSVTDITSILMRYKKKHKRKIKTNPLVLELYTPYIAMVNFVQNYAPPASKNCKRRFLVYTSFGYFTPKSPVKAFESHFHKFD